MQALATGRATRAGGHVAHGLYRQALAASLPSQALHSAWGG